MYKYAILVCMLIAYSNAQCPSITTASGSFAPTGVICSGDLIFEDNFNDLNLERWQHEATLAGGGNWEFQWYLNNRSNSYTQDGVLHIRPTLTVEILGEDGLRSAQISSHGGGAPYDTCTNPSFYGCERSGFADSVLNPIRSARLRTLPSFAFKYGRIEISARNPAGDWLWPALWLMPKRNEYGTWPVSGEIDLMESRGNLNLIQNGENIGAEHVGQTLHFGPYVTLNAWDTATFARKQPGNPFSNDFHRYQMEWTPNYIRFLIDDIETGVVGPGFWDRGGFAQRAPGTENPWRFASPMAPFDQEFYVIINLAVGGIAYFPDDAQNPGGKPWSNTSGQASTDFWVGRNQWEPTWNLGTDNANFRIDYVRVWAI